MSSRAERAARRGADELASQEEQAHSAAGAAAGEMELEAQEQQRQQQEEQQVDSLHAVAAGLSGGVLTSFEKEKRTGVQCEDCSKQVAALLLSRARR